MDKISWCKTQKDGIKLIEPTERISQKYYEEAEKDLEEMNKAESLKWKDIQGYYACYNALYAILQRIGIKSEIHDCTIELLNYIEGFSEEQKTFLKKLKEKRIGAQYYLEPAQIDQNKIHDFVLTCKNILNNINPEDIKKIRKRIATA
ncbi:TPA: HEPN domain-containing protein [Candidatus Woesearchaeota archaeon]|nr:HEPN domain-containing protein [Candidatus Woesearchaeota archaeon]